MEEVLTYGVAAPFIVAVLGLVRLIVPEVRGRLVPLLALGFTVAWGGVLVFDGRFTGGLAEFIATSVLVATAAIGGASAVNTFTREGSTLNRLT